MKKVTIWQILLAIGLVTMPVALGVAQDQQQSLTEGEAFKLGVDAYIYGYPLVVMDSVRRVNTNVARPI